MIRFLCKTCHQKIKIEEKYVDRNIQCPRCKSVNKASERLSPEAPAPAPSSVSSGNTSDTVILRIFRCQSCHQKIRINEKYADQKIKCPRCKNLNTISQTPLPQTPIPTQPSASENVTIVNFTTPRMRLYGNDSADTLENELLISIEPVSDSDPTPEEPDPAKETTKAPEPVPASESVPAPEPPVPPGLSPKEKHENGTFIVPARAKTKLKSLVVFPIALGILLGSIAIYGYWQNHNSQRQSFVSDTAGNEKKPTKSYSYSLPKEDVEEPKDIHPAKQHTKVNQLAYIKSLGEFADVVMDLHDGIEKGLELSEFISKSMRLSQAYRKIKVSPEIKLIIDFDLSLMAKQYTQGAGEIVPSPNGAMEVQERSVIGGDEAGYLLYRLAQAVKKQANALAQQWDANVKISSRSTSAAAESSVGREVSGYRVLQRLLECMETFITKYKGYVGSPGLNHIQ